MALVMDPVCGMEFDHRSAWDRSVYHNRTFHFCHPMCKELFDSDPTRFVEEELPTSNARPEGLSTDRTKTWRRVSKPKRVSENA